MEPNKDISEINPNPFSLPAGFKWNDLDLENKDELMELYTLLNENYVEDDDNMRRTVMTITTCDGRPSCRPSVDRV